MVKQRLFAASLLIACQGVFAEADQPNTSPDPFEWKKALTVQSLPYGNALFEYYRGEHFASMTALLIAQDRSQLGVHEQSALALLGSQQLNYGMLKEAESVLTGALALSLPQDVREKILVDLARVRFRSGDLDGSLSRIEALTTLSSVELNDELTLMRANIALQTKKGQDAQNALASISQKSVNYGYALFNLGVAQLQQEQTAAAQETFAQLLKLPAQTEAEKVLKDRTYLAFGYEHLRQKQPAEARAQLLNVRLDSAYTNSALLGLGWAYAQSGLYENALTPWLTLMEKRPADLSVLEAQLAVPYAYSSLEAYPDAINSYRSAIARFDEEAARLDAAREAVDQGELLALLPYLEDEAIPEVLMANAKADAPLLKRVLSLHTFNESLRRYRELLELKEVLKKWQVQLPIYSEMLANHRARYAEKAPAAETALAKVDMAQLTARVNAAKQTFEDAKLPENWLLLANNKEQSLHKRAERATEKLAKIMAVKGPMQKEEEKLRLMKGVLQFNVWHESAGRQWAQEKLLKDSEASLRLLDTQRAKLLAAKDVAGNRFNFFDERIERQLGGAEQLIERADVLLNAEGQRLNRIALEEINRWQAQVNNYRQQSELALARLQDRSVIGAKP